MMKETGKGEKTGQQVNPSDRYYAGTLWQQVISIDYLANN